MFSKVRAFTTKRNNLFTKFGNHLEKLESHEKVEFQAKLCVWAIAVEMTGNYNAIFKNLNHRTGEYSDNLNEALALVEGMNLIEINNLIDAINKNNDLNEAETCDQILFAA